MAASNEVDAGWQRPLSFALGEVEREAALVAVVEQPAIGMVRLGHARQLWYHAESVARAWRLDLDDVGAEIGQECRCRRCGDETPAVDNLQTFEDLAHRLCLRMCDLGCQLRLV